MMSEGLATLSRKTKIPEWEGAFRGLANKAVVEFM